MKNTTNKEINSAIFKVITTQFKKDAKEAHEAVKQAGFDIFKRDGAFWVVNHETHKTIYCEFSEYRGYYLDIHNKRILLDDCIYRDKPCPFDFANYLNTPNNKDWYKVREMAREDFSDAVWKYHRICDSKSLIKSWGKNIKEAQKKIEVLQADIIRYAKYQAQEQVNLEKLKEDFKLA